MKSYSFQVIVTFSSRYGKQATIKSEKFKLCFTLFLKISQVQEINSLQGDGSING